MCPLQWGKQAPSPAPGPLPHPLTLTHTPPVMFAGLSKESINSDLVAVRCGPLCGVVTFSEWESEFSRPPLLLLLLLHPSFSWLHAQGMRKGLKWECEGFRVVAGGGVWTWIERVFAATCL